MNSKPSTIGIFKSVRIKSQGFRVNNSEASELLTLNPCDLILTDLNMPIVDGLEFIRIVRQREALIGNKKPIMYL